MKTKVVKEAWIFFLPTMPFLLVAPPPVGFVRKFFRFRRRREIPAVKGLRVVFAGFDSSYPLEGNEAELDSTPRL